MNTIKKMMTENVLFYASKMAFEERLKTGISYIKASIANEDGSSVTHIVPIRCSGSAGIVGSILKGIVEVEAELEKYCNCTKLESEHKKLEHEKEEDDLWWYLELLMASRERFMKNCYEEITDERISDAAKVEGFEEFKNVKRAFLIEKLSLTNKFKP